MIYTVTFSPAIDYVVYLDDLRPGEINRSTTEDYYFGGKGINVSRILNQLGVENTALGFVSGFTGQALEAGLQQLGIMTDFVHLSKGITRINIKVKTNCETEINTQGALIEEADLCKLMEKLETLRKGDILVISGNIPNTLPKDIYQRILERLSNREISFVIDATGELLKKTLRYKPFLVKPNQEELEELVGKSLDSMEKIWEGAGLLQKLGARNVLVSMGKNGACLLNEEGRCFQTKAITGKAVNTVGAGDSLVAGFLAGYLLAGNFEYGLQLGSAAGSATAFSETLATEEEILSCFEKY